MADQLPHILPLKYTCEKCNFRCSNKKDYNRHLLTAKHKRLTDTSIRLTQNANEFVCNCGKTYSHRQSLHKHKKKCKSQSEEQSNDNKSEQPMFLQMIIQYFETLRQSEQEQRKSEQ